MPVLFPQTPEDSREVVRGIDETGALVFEQVGVEELLYKGRYGALAHSSTEHTISIGEKYFTLNLDDGKFRVGDDILINSLDDPECFMWGEVIGKDTVDGPVRLRVYIDDISDLSLTGSNWELQVVARPKPGIEKDTSTSSVNPTTAGPYTFTVTAGKFFPIGGKLLIKPTTDRTIALIGKVSAYNGTTLIVKKVNTNATVSTSYTSWSIALLDAPQDAIPFYQINGLRVSVNATDSINDIDILAGSVRDSTDTVDLVLPSKLTKRMDAAFAAGTNQGSYVQSANLAGTITSAGINVTGTGTAFLTDFGGASGGLSDFTDQYNAWLGSHSAENQIISSGAVTTSFNPSTNTAGVSGVALGASGATYKRGGPVSAGGGLLTIAVVLVQKDSDGSTDVITVSFNGTGVPDRPSGYTYYRVLARLLAGGGSAIDASLIVQPLKGLSGSNATEGMYFDEANWFGGDLTTQDAITGLVQAKVDNVFTNRGDILTHDGSTPIRRGIGASGTIVSTDGTDTLFQTAKALGLPVLLASGSPSGVSTLDIVLTSYSGTGYSKFHFILYDLNPSAGSNTLWMRTSTDGGSTYDSGASAYRYTGMAHIDSAAAVGFHNNTGASRVELTLGNVDNNANNLCRCEVEIFNPFGANRQSGFFKSVWVTTTPRLGIAQGSWMRDATTDVDAVRFLFSSGTFTGKYRLLGYP